MSNTPILLSTSKGAGAYHFGSCEERRCHITLHCQQPRETRYRRNCSCYNNGVHRMSPQRVQFLIALREQPRGRYLLTRDTARNQRQAAVFLRYIADRNIAHSKTLIKPQAATLGGQWIEPRTFRTAAGEIL